MSHCLVRILGWRSDWAILFRKWGQKCSNSELCTLSQHDNRIFVASIGQYGYGRRVVPAGQRNLSHCAQNNWVVRKFLWPCHLTQWWSELGTKVVRFDTMRLLSLGVYEISCLCQQTTNNSWSQGGDSTCHWQNWAAVMPKCHREFRQKIKSVPAESWRPCVGYCVPQLITVSVLCTEIKLSALFE